MRRWLVICAAGLAIFMAALDMMVVNVALPTLANEFGVPAERSAWVILAYNLPLVALLLPLGRWVDALDRRKAFLLGVLGFAGASVLVGVAPSFAFVLVSRFLQGVFASLMVVLVPPLVMDAAALEKRGRAMGVIGTLGPLGSVTGPALGGFLLAAFGWRSIFFINVPVCFLAMAIGAYTINGGGLSFRWPGRSWAKEAAVFGTAVLALFLALGAFGRGFSGSTTLVPSVLLGAGIVAALFWAQFEASRPVISLVSMRSFGFSLGALMMIAAVGSALQYLTSFFLQEITGASTQGVGLTLLALPLAMAVMGPVGGYLADRWATKPTMLLGAVWAAIALLLVLPLRESWSSFDVAWRLGLIGVGCGLFTGPNMAALMGAAPATLRGSASGLAGLSRNLGFAIGPSLMAATWAYLGSEINGMRVGLGVALIATMLAVVAAASVHTSSQSEKAESGKPSVEYTEPTTTRGEARKS